MTTQETTKISSKPAKAEPEYAIALAREDINALPISRYDGGVTLVRGEDGCAEACDRLRREAVLGFDTETRPSFRKGESYLPSLIQLAGTEHVYLFQLIEHEIPAPLQALLGDATVLKTGVSLDYDLKQLRQLADFEPAGFVSLEPLAKALRIKNQGLRGLAAALFGFRISKKAQCSNWSRRELTDVQINYAATDAWISLRLYQELMKRIEAEGVSIPTPAPRGPRAVGA